MIAYTEQIATRTPSSACAANAILPGLMDTPMAVDTRARTWGKSRAEVEAMRNARVPLRRKMGTGWDVAYAALFLASEEANFITGIGLLVDGGGSLRKEWFEEIRADRQGEERSTLRPCSRAPAP